MFAKAVGFFLSRFYPSIFQDMWYTDLGAVVELNSHSFVHTLLSLNSERARREEHTVFIYFCEHYFLQYF